MAMPKETTKIAKRPPKPTPTKKGGSIEIAMIPVEDLIPDDENPNAMDEATFDQLVEEIAEQGFDEPVLVREHPTQKGKYQIGSGHHRTKAAIVNGMTEVPAIIKHWTDREQKVALVKRNALRGELNKAKLTHLYRDLAKGKDGVQVQRELGFTNPKKFEAMIDKVEQQLPPKARKKLQEAKETIKSVDDLSSVLNRIFKESGSELDQGYMVFSFGGKEHHYFQIDDETNKKLHAIKKHCDTHDVPYTEALQSIVAQAVDLGSLPTERKGGKPPESKPIKKRRPVKKRKK